MNCEQVLSRLSDYLDRALDAGDIAALEAHLEACGACRSESEALVRTIRGVGELAEVEPPANLVPNVMAQIHKTAEKPTFWRSLFFPLHVKVPVQAMAILIVSGLAVYLYMTAERSQMEFGHEKAAPTAPVTSMTEKEEEPAVAAGDRRFAQAPPGPSARKTEETGAEDARPGKALEMADEYPEDVEIARAREYAATPKQPAVGTVVAKAPERPAVSPKAEGETARPAEAPERDLPGRTLEALMEAGRSHTAGARPGAVLPEVTLRRELELLFAPSQGTARDTSTRESLARLVEQLGGRLTATDPTQPDAVLSQQAVPHVFWVSLPEARYDRFRRELSSQGILTPVSAPAPAPTESESTAGSPWVRIKLTIETPQ